jgi:hypothetical protein
VRFAFVLVAACAAPPAAVPSNHAAAGSALRQHFEVMAVEEYATCTAPHHVTISVDGAVRATVVVPCAVPPVPHNGIVVTDSSPRVTNGVPFDVPPGRHRIGVRDLETGLADEHDGVFPIHGSLGNPQPEDKALAADTLVILLHVDWIRGDVVAKANLILL